MSRLAIPRIEGFSQPSVDVEKMIALTRSRLTNTGGYLAAGMYACKMPLRCGAYRMASHVAYTPIYLVFFIRLKHSVALS